jgi:hypothetical protein
MALIVGKTYEITQKVKLDIHELTHNIEERLRNIGEQVVWVEGYIYVPPIELGLINYLKNEFVYRIVFVGIMDRKDWKSKTPYAYMSEDFNTAVFLAYCVSYFTGGCWVIRNDRAKNYYVYSEGYRYYTGA